MSNREVMQQALEQQAEPVARNDFEKWAKSLPNYMDISRFEAGYSDCNTDYAWAAWKAALAQPQQQAEPLAMRMPEVGDKIICLEDESLGEVVSLTAGGSPDVTFDDGSRGTYMLSEFAELFGYVAPPQQQAEPSKWRDMVVVTLVREGIDKHRARELADHFATPPAAERPWVGLTSEEVLDLFDRNNVYGSKWIEFARTVEDKLKEKNDH